MFTPLESFLDSGRSESEPDSPPTRRRSQAGPRDFQKENVLSMRQKQDNNRRKLEEQAKEKKAFKMKRFQDVAARTSSTRDASPPRAEERRPATKKAPARKPSAAAAQTARTRTLTKPPVPRAAEALPLPERQSKNFVSQNARENIARVPVSAAVQPRATDREDFAKVPAYIIERKIQVAEAQRQQDEQARREAECPPGMILMAEEDRLATLATIEQNKAEILREMARLPVVIDTFGLKRKKTLLETKLKKLEEAVVLFSRSKVYIDQNA